MLRLANDMFMRIRFWPALGIGCGGPAARPRCTAAHALPPPARLPSSPPCSNFTYTRALQAAALAYVIVASLCYLYFIARPYFATTQAESRKIAEAID